MKILMVEMGVMVMMISDGDGDDGGGGSGFDGSDEYNSSGGAVKMAATRMC